MRIDLLQAAIPASWKVATLSTRLLERVWSHVAGAKSEWACRVFASRDDLRETLEQAVVLIETPWGLLNADGYELGWKVMVHALVWSPEAFRPKELEALRGLLEAAPSALHVVRIECQVLGSVPSVERLLERVGFVYEGSHKLGAKDASGAIVDRKLYAIVV